MQNIKKTLKSKRFWLGTVLPFALAVAAAFVARYQLEISDGVTANYMAGQWPVYAPLNALTAFCLTLVVFALCGTAVFLLFPAQLLGLFSASDEMLAFGVPALRIISVTFLFAVTTILCGYFASGLGNGVVNMIGGALRQLVVLVPCLWFLIRTMGIDRAWFAFWVSEVIACAYSLWATKKELRNKGK